MSPQCMMDQSLRLLTSYIQLLAKAPRLKINPVYVSELPVRWILEDLLDTRVRFILLLRHEQSHIPFNAPGEVETGPEIVIFCHGGIVVDAGIRGLPLDVTCRADAVIEVAVSEDRAYLGILRVIANGQ